MPNSADRQKKIKVEVVKEEIPETKEEIKEAEKTVGEEIVTSETPQTETKEAKKEKNYGEKTPFWVLFLVFLLGLTLGAGLIGGIFYYQSKMEKTAVQTPSPTPAASENQAEATPTPSTEETKLSELKVQILNGSGIKGEAGKVEAILKENGLTQTETGNADSYDYQETTVSLKSNLPDSVYETISKALTGYSLKKGELEKESPYDIKIIVGKKKS